MAKTSELNGDGVKAGEGVPSGSAAAQTPITGRALRNVARLSSWLHFHIFLGVQGMVCVVFHSMHLFTRSFAVNLMNPAVLNFIAVTIVFCSGLSSRSPEKM